MVSFLDRSFEDQAVRVIPTPVRLESGNGFLPGLRRFTSDVNAMGHNDSWGSFVITGLPVTLSYPQAIND
jgi:hypothetical protein